MFFASAMDSIDGLGHVVCFHIDGENGVADFTNKFYDSCYYRYWKETGDRAWNVAGNYIHSKQNDKSAGLFSFFCLCMIMS